MRRSKINGIMTDAAAFNRGFGFHPPASIGRFATIEADQPSVVSDCPAWLG